MANGLPPEIEMMVQSLINEQLEQYQTRINELERELAIGKQNQITQEQYSELQEKYYTARDQADKLKEINRDLENQKEKFQEKIKQMNEKAAKDNQDMSFNVADLKSKDAQIEDLKKKVQDLQSQIDTNKKELITNNEMFGRKDGIILTLRNKNNELVDALKVMSDNYEILKKELIERGDLINNYEEKIQELGLTISGQKEQLESSMISPQGNESTVINIPIDNTEKIDSMRKKNHSLKERVLELEEIERSYERLQKEFEKRNQQIEFLNNEIDKMQIEFEKNRITLEKSVHETEFYRDQFKRAQVDLTSENERLKNKVDFLEKRNKELDEMRDGNYDEKIKRSKEIDELRQQIAEYESQTFGLKSVVSSTKQLKAQLDVRDKHISVLVHQLNTMDKILNGLVLQIKPDFDLEDFLKKLDTVGEDEEKIRIEKAMKELNEKMALMRQKNALTNIEIETADDDVQFDLNKKKSHKKSKKRHVTMAIPDSENTIPKTLDQSKHGKTFLIHSDTATFNLHEPQPSDTDEVIEQEMTPIQEGEKPYSDFESKDDWFKYIIMTLQGEKEKLQNQLETVQKDYSDLLLRNKDLEMEIEDLHNQLQAMAIANQATNQIVVPDMSQTPEPPKEGNMQTLITESLQKFIQPISNQIQSRPKPVLSISSSFYYKTSGISTSKEAQALQERNGELEAQNQILQDLITKLQEEAKQLHKQLSDAEQTINSLRIQLEQRDKSLQANDETIKLLNHRLQEEKEKFNQSLLNMQNEAQLYIQRRLDEEKDRRAVEDMSKFGSYDDENLEKIEKQIQQLTLDKRRLLKELNEANSAASVAKRDSLMYQQRIKELQDQILDLQSRTTNPGQKDLKAYNTKITIRLKNLEKKYADLEEENEALKKFKSRAPGDTLMNSIKSQSEHAIDGDSSNLGSTKQIKQSQNRITRLTVENEELQMRLEKANATIERLNQLLQRKETQLTKLQERTAKTIQAKEKEIIRKTPK